MRILRAFAMALGMYTALPGFARWDDGLRGLLAAMLPPVGLVIGLLWWGAAALSAAFLPPLLGAVAAALLPPLLSGMLHLDGFMDVSDALLSRRDRDEKLRILKDPHAGAFAVIALCCLLLLQVGAAQGVLAGKALWALVFLPIVSRALAGLAIMTCPPLPQSWYARMHHESATPGRRLACALWLVAALLLAFALDWRAGIACLGAALAFCAACACAIRQLGGMNGDISGFSICFCELAGLILLVCL